MLDTKDNRDNLAALIEQLMRPNETILFAGAGVSSAAGYPGWNALMDRMEEKIPEVLKSDRDVARVISPKDIEQIKNIKDLLWRAEVYRKVLGKPVYDNVLAEQFKANLYQGPAQIAEALVRLRFAHILTTNFEPSLEDAYLTDGPTSVFDWSEEDKTREFITHKLHRTQDRCFIYLHGRIISSATPTVPENLILCDSDYVERYILTLSTVHKLLAIFMTRPVLFVGFSFTDPAVQMIFQALTAHLGGADSADCTHFILSPEPAEGNDRADSSWLRGKYGVQPVYYKRDEKHRDLTETLEQIAEVIEECKADYESLDRAAGRLRIQESLQHIASTKHTSFAPTIESVPRKPSADDPNKWQFGSQSSRDGYHLAATVTEIRRGWFQIVLRVTADLDNPLNFAKFFLHPSLSSPSNPKPAVNGQITLELEAYGAFTVGVLINPPRDGDPRSLGVTALELDLAELPDAPPLFRSR